jgi:hypothetical protein
MILNCRVVAVELGSQFTDEQERITVFIEEADPMHNKIRVVNAERLSLGQEFRLVASVGKDAAEANPTHPHCTCGADRGHRQDGTHAKGCPAGFVDSKPAGYISKGSGA